MMLHVLSAMALAGRSADVVIVSDEPGGQYNRLGSQGPLDGCVESETARAAWTKVPLRNKTRAGEIETVAADKPAIWPAKVAADNPVEAVLGKTHRTEF